MKKAIFILSALLFGLVSCVEPLSDIPQLPKAEETGLVAITMELEIPQVELLAETKALGDRSHTPSIKDIRVAVFGTSGYPQAYTLAEPVDASGNPISNYATANNTKYYFRVLLPVYDGEAHVHIIANGDESIPFVDQKEKTIMENMKTTGNVGAFWARVILPDGILPIKDQNGIMQTDQQTGHFIPDGPTERAFKNLVLIRNFAEVTLSVDTYAPNQSHLENITWTLVNYPTTGSVAPMAGGTYVDDYAKYVYNPKTGQMVLAQMDEVTGNPVMDANGNIANIYEVYEGFMFEDSMNYDIPSAITTTPSSSLFVYERPHPGSDKATCILLKAQFHDGTSLDSDYSYYRLDLMNEAVGGYFPLYRNYKYQVRIHKVGNRGAATPDEAMNRDSGGNVSLSTEAQKLTDISDGTSRLYVEYVEKNFTSGGKKTLWVKFVPDVSTGTVDNSKVSIGIKEQGTALVSGSEVTVKDGSSNTGYKIFEFELNGQSTTGDLTSVLEVKAVNDEDEDNINTLYRDVTLRVLKKMDMTLSLAPNQVTGTNTAKTVLNIVLPDGLPSSIFPLEFHIEDVNHTLNPTGLRKNGDNTQITIPVKTAKSLADDRTSSFYFIRTVNESEYDASHTISTQFQTLSAANASATTFYVANEYFTTQSINLLSNGIYVNPTNATVAFDVTSVVIELEMATSTGWTVTGGSGVTVSPATGTGNGSFTMSFTQNNSTTTSVIRTATVSSGNESHTVSITQLPMQFSIAPVAQTIPYNMTSAEITIYAEEGKSWTLEVEGPSGTNPSLSPTSGTGTQTVTLTMPANTVTSQRRYTVTATMTNPSATATATVTQRKGSASPYPFNASAFTISNYNGSATSSDDYVSIALTGAQKSGSGANAYLTMGYTTTSGFIFTTYTPHRGSITVTPVDGFKITQIKVTYSDATYAGYDFGNTSVTCNTGTYTRDGNNSATATWTGSSTGAVTFTNGYQNNSNNYNYPRIRSIEVTYAPI
jgi:hypothetical protein